jgi:hypothetical protein
VDPTAPLALLLIGLGGVAAGVTGLALPRRDRLAAALPLVAGAGVGLATLGAGWALLPLDASPRAGARLFLLASALGLVTVVAGLAVLWRRARDPARSAGR